MTLTLRPMSLSEILDSTFEIFRSNLAAFIVLSALPALAMMSLEVANQFWWRLLPDSFGPRVFLWFTPQILLYQLVLTQIGILLNILFWPAFALVVSKFVSGERTGAASALAACRLRWSSWLGLGFANWLAALLFPELVMAILLAGTAYLLFEVLGLDPGPSQLGPRVFLASLVIGWCLFQWLSAGFSLSVPVWMLEKTKIRAALRRGWRISKSSRFSLFFARMMPLIVGRILTFAGTTSVFFLMYAALKHTAYWPYAYRRALDGASIFISFVVATVVGPIFPIALTLIYYDQRIRLEGYDIERLIEASGMNTPVPALTLDIVFTATEPEETGL
jgi:hypothetical protein